MPRRVYHDPLIIRPPDDLADTRPDLVRDANELARAYRKMGEAFAAGLRGDGLTVISDDALRAVGTALWLALTAADPALPDRLAARQAEAGTWLLPLIIESDVPAVHRLPWETLHHPTFGFLGRDDRFTLSRRFPGPAPNHRPDPGPLRVILFTCLPDDVDPERGRLEIEEQQARALEALGQADADGRVVLRMPDDGRFATFRALIQEFDPHLVFLFAHGKFVDEPGQTEPPYVVIQFEGDDGHSHLVREDKVAGAFHGYGVRAVVLAACESGMGASAALAAGLAGAISRAGVPHVLGMRESVLTRAAIAFNTAFANAILDREQADTAAQLARAEIKQPLAGIEGLDPAAAELSLGQWPLPALISPNPAAPLIDWDFDPRPPRRAAAPSDSLGGIPLPNPFIGRRSELRDWQAPFLSGRQPVLLISGVGGRGKTALAGKLALGWLAGGRAAIGWSARDGMASWDAFIVDLIQRVGEEAFAAATAGVHDETQRATTLLRLLLARHNGRLLLYLDNLETLQDGRTLAWSDERLAAFVAAARELAKGGTGLRLLVTTRARPPGWPDAAHRPLRRVLYGDFLQLARERRAPAAFWRPGRPERIYDTLDGNARGLEFVAGALSEMADPAAEAEFLQRLRDADERVRVDIALATLIANLDGEARALLDRLPAYDVAMPLDGIRAIALDHPDVARALQRLAAVGLVEETTEWHEEPDLRQTTYQIAAPAAAWLAEQPGYALDPAWLRAAAGYQQWLLDNERPTLEQAVVLHRALTRAGERAAADELALNGIIQALHRAGLYQILLNEWLPALRESADEKTRAAGLNWSGTCHHALGDYTNALRYLEQSLAIQQAIGDRAGEGVTLSNISQIYQARGDYPAALRFLEQSLAIMQAIGDRAGVGQSLNNISQIYRARGDYTTALRFLEQSLAIRQAIGDRAGEGATLNNISAIYHARGDYTNALRFLEQSLAITQAIGDRAGEGTTLNNISGIYRARGDYTNALRYLEQSLAIRQAIGDRAGEGTTLNNMATAAHARGDYTNALRFLEQSLAIQRAIGDRAGEGTTLNNISQIYDARGDYTNALRFLEQSLAIMQAIGDRAGEGAALNNMAAAAHARGDYTNALRYLEQSLAIRQAIGDRAGEGTTLNNISQIYDARGDYTNALRFLEQSLAIQRAIGDRAGEGTTLNNMATAAHARGDYTNALRFLEQSLAIRQAIGDAAGLCATLFNMGHIYAQNKQLQEALGAWVAVYQIASRIGNAQALAELTKLAGQIGLPGGLEGWAALARQAGGSGEGA